VPRKVLVSHGGSAFDLIEVPAENEYHLQNVMKDSPALLPIDDLGITGPLLVVGRESGVASGSIDLVGAVPSGDLVLVEFKTGPQNPDFRHALAQLIDYGSNLWGMTVEEFDKGIVQRYLDSRYCPATYQGCRALAELADRAWAPEEFSWDEFVDRLARVLRDGDFHYVVAAQKFTPQMTRALEYLNTVTQAGHYHLVQMIQFNGQDMTAYAAQAVTPPPAARHAAAGAGVSEAAFLAALDDDAYRQALGDIFDSCRALSLTFAWGTRGSSIRLATPDRSEPLSVGWIFPGTPSWSGLTHLTLGYDSSSARRTPSVVSALDAYLGQVAQIAGATAVTSKTIKAYTCNPAQVTAAKAQIIETLEALVAAASGAEPDQQAPAQPSDHAVSGSYTTADSRKAV
jgi:hypothetical protein